VAEVTILMACLNGAAFLPRQLDSIAGQHGVDWQLLAGDDGSSDDTLALLERFSAHWPGRVSVVAGPRAGVSAHFLALVAQAGPGALAFADQDDVWLPGKLQEALAALDDCGPVPALFLSRGALWWGGDAQKAMPVPHVAPGFNHALVQNIGPGHAMVVNAAAADLLRRGIARGAAPFWHDWWAYQMIAGAGGHILLGHKVQVLYRQHGDNLLGRSQGPAAARKRLGRAASGEARREMAAQLAALQLVRDEMTDEARDMLDGFASAAPKGLRRAKDFWRLGLRRQGVLGRGSVVLAAWMGAL
jgi:glycosyltransferase involved in cell wall biosynthesis